MSQSTHQPGMVLLCIHEVYLYLQYPHLRISESPANTCGSIKVFNKEGDSIASWTQYNCFPDWYGLNLYRTLTTTTTGELE